MQKERESLILQRDQARNRRDEAEMKTGLLEKKMKTTKDKIDTYYKTCQATEKQLRANIKTLEKEKEELEKSTNRVETESQKTIIMAYRDARDENKVLKHEVEKWKTSWLELKELYDQEHESDSSSSKSGGTPKAYKD